VLLSPYTWPCFFHLGRKVPKNCGRNDHRVITFRVLRKEGEKSAR
jgi:hypothetical protein